eukprot:TRINITY_DN49_c0_g1_i3.p3 TRINITY_DN49_c0_g1~~TRINITY_DN49_c0_g1_i3.p3  ORF type:complete len:130 (+),score=46.65 TRINITY_DN49_c0_g1_i3:533-922(+)
MAEEATIRTRKFKLNPLLKRKQMVVEVVHHGRPNVPKSELAEKIAKMYKADPTVVVLYGFRSKFGGGYSNGFALIYDDLASLKEFEPNYRQIRLGLKKQPEGSSKQRKERKNRAKKLKGTAKNKAAGKK